MRISVSLDSSSTWLLRLGFLILMTSASNSASSECGLPDVDETGGLTLGYKGKKVTHGQRVDLSAAKEPPDMTVDIQDTQGGEALVLLMIDPDAPTPESCPDKYWLHWIALVTVKKGAVHVKQTLLDYYPPSPPPASSLHRYQLVLYPLSKEPSKSHAPKNRSGFSLSGFKSALGIQGDYVAGTQFKAGHNKK